MPSPLFKMASATIRAAAVRDFSRSRFGRLMGEVSRTSGRSPQRLNEVVRRYGRHFDPSKMIQEAMGSDLRQVVRQVELYSRRGGVSRKLLDEFLAALGPAGNLIRALAGSGSGRGASKALEGQMAAATRLLEAHGSVVIPAGKSPSVAQAGRGIEGLIKYLESVGHKVIREEDEPKPRTSLPFGISENTRAGERRRLIELPGPAGEKVRLPREHPAITGDFVRATGSDNVHSYAYDAEKAYLYIRFLAAGSDGEKTSSPGSLYRYRDISPRQFTDLHNSNSKGNWVWDNLRVRGTVAGYQKPYALVGVMSGYVPRQATYMGKGEEWFIRRRMHAGGGRWLVSERADELVGPGVYRGGANTARPQGPNRARANTARP